MAVTVQVLFFARAREITACHESRVELPEGSTSADLLKKLLEVFPGLSELASCAVLAVNQEYCSATAPVALKSGDEVAFIPPISGG